MARLSTAAGPNIAADMTETGIAEIITTAEITGAVGSTGVAAAITAGTAMAPGPTIGARAVASW